METFPAFYGDPQGLAQWMVAVGFFLTVLAFVVSDILWLRGVTIAAKLLMAVAALLPETGPVWLSFWGNMLLIGINLVHSLLLIAERRRAHLSDEEQALKDLAFPSLDRVAVKRLFRIAHWENFEAGTTLLVAGEKPINLYLFLTGGARVLLEHRRIGSLGRGQFAGEMSFLSGSEAGATVVTSKDSRCLVWNRPLVEQLCRRDPDLHASLIGAIGTDLAAKVVAQNRLAVKAA